MNIEATDTKRWWGRGKILYLGGESSGIDVRYRKAGKTLSIGGWYDHFVGIEAQEIPLADFLKGLGITRKDCTAAFAKELAP